MVTNNIEEYKGVYVFAQQVDNEISGIALELLGKGKELAAKLETEVTAVLIGYNVKGLADKLAEYGADKVILREAHVIHHVTSAEDCSKNWVMILWDC